MSPSDRERRNLLAPSVPGRLTTSGHSRVQPRIREVERTALADGVNGRGEHQQLALVRTGETFSSPAGNTLRWE